MKANPDDVVRFAIILVQMGRTERKAFNQVMRARFPRITDHTLHEARRNAKIWLAIKQVTTTITEQDS